MLARPRMEGQVFLTSFLFWFHPQFNRAKASSLSWTGCFELTKSGHKQSRRSWSWVTRAAVAYNYLVHPVHSYFAIFLSRVIYFVISSQCCSWELHPYYSLQPSGRKPHLGFPQMSQLISMLSSPQRPSHLVCKWRKLVDNQTSLPMQSPLILY